MTPFSRHACRTYALLAALFGTPSVRADEAMRQALDAMELTLQALAASSLTTSSLTAMLDQTAAQTDTLAAWVASSQEAAQANIALRAALLQAAEHPADNQLLAAVDQARSALADAQDSMHIARQELEGVAAAVIGEAAWADLEGIRNQSGRRLPPHYFAASLEEDEEWAELEAALVAEARAARLGRSLATWAAQRLRGVNADAEVVRSRLDFPGKYAMLETYVGVGE